MPFTFNAVELCIVIINEKNSGHARERSAGHLNMARLPRMLKAHVSPENYAHKWQLIKVTAVSTSVNWAKDSRKDDYYFKSTAKGKRIQKALL